MIVKGGRNQNWVLTCSWLVALGRNRPSLLGWTSLQWMKSSTNKLCGACKLETPSSTHRADAVGGLAKAGKPLFPCFRLSLRVIWSICYALSFLLATRQSTAAPFPPSVRVQRHFYSFSLLRMIIMYCGAIENGVAIHFCALAMLALRRFVVFSLVSIDNQI
jgi:hypothetical protein